MPRCPENRLDFRSLYDGSLVSIRDYQCYACRGGPAHEEFSERNDIVLMRRGAFCKHSGRHIVTADANQAVFFSKGSTYQISHPTDDGDRGTVLVVAPSLLNDIIREHDPSVDDRSERPFPFVLGPCSNSACWQHFQLVQRLNIAEADPPEPLWVDSIAVQLVSDVLGTAFSRHGFPRKRQRPGTAADHADRAEAVKSWLASRLSDRVTLNDVARGVHVSPFHLARLFREHACISIHRYLNRLRLRAALERLRDSPDDLTALALDVGFSSHSHFSDAFRREFGLSPSTVRKHAIGRTIRELSKNLEA